MAPCQRECFARDAQQLAAGGLWTPNHLPGAGTMNLGEYKAMFELESYYWWYIARRKVIGEFLSNHLEQPTAPRRILDVGCGTGINNALLSKFGDVHGVDMAEAAL